MRRLVASPKRRTFLILLGLVLLFPAGWAGYVSHLAAVNDQVCGGPPIVGNAETEMLKQLLNDYSAKNKGVGLQATVIFPDGTLWEEAAGFASLEKRCPMTPGHHLYIGSMTKLYTATLVMGQVEKGTFSLDDPIGKWIPLPQAGKVTLKMLLEHRSGLPDYAWDPWFDVRYLILAGKSWHSRELLDIIREKPLHFEPGKRYEYSNSNYLLLGMILEQATGKAYGGLLRELVMEKLGLHGTFFQDGPAGLITANGYDESLLHMGRRMVSGLRTSIVSGAYSAGGILTTANEVARFVQALFSKQILEAPALAQMTTFMDAPDEGLPEQTGYGLGMRRLLIGGEQLLGHTGTILGYSGIAMHNEAKGYTIVVLSNLSTIDQAGLLEEIQGIVMKRLEE